MGIQKSCCVIFFICLMALKSPIKANTFSTTTTYSAEQLTLIKNAFNNSDFLIGDQLLKLDAKNLILTDFNELQLNTYLSGFKNDSFIVKNVSLTFQNPSKRELSNTTIKHFITAINYYFNGYYLSVIASFKKSLITAYKLDDLKKTTLISINLSRLYLLNNDFSKAEENNKIAIKYYRLSNDKLVNFVIFKAQIALLNKRYKNAENIILKNALMLSRQSRNKKSELQCYYELGKIYLKDKRFTEAKWFFIQSVMLVDKLNLRLSKIKSLLLLVKVKNLIQDHSLALKDLILVKKMSDSFNKAYQIDLQFELAQTYSYLSNEVKSHQSLLNYDSLKKYYLLHNF